MADMLSLLTALWGDQFSLGDFAVQSPRALLSVDVIQAVRQSDLIGKICYVVLAFFSVLSWAVIGYKLLHIYHANRQTNQCVDLCMSGSGSLDEAYKHAGEYPDSPLAQILRETYLELQIESWYREAGQLSFSYRLELAKVGIERILQRTSANEVRHLESYLIFLATTAAVCPFIGLFGTVWGIMTSFRSIGMQGSATLAVVAPGIAEALIATAAGLAAAIPAVIAFNYFNRRIRALQVDMGNFNSDLVGLIERGLIRIASAEGRKEE